MNIEGTIHVKGETQKISEKFSKRELVIKTKEKYPQFIACQLSQDKCGLLDFYNVGDEVNASINLRGREWTSPKGEVKYFNTLEVWKLTSNEVPQDIPTTNVIPKMNGDMANQFNESHGDDLPF